MPKVTVEESIAVPKSVLKEILAAVRGPDYLIRELQAISRIQGDKCPITRLEQAYLNGIGETPQDQSYDIRVSEKQREALLWALIHHRASRKPEEEMREEELIDMLRDAEPGGVLNMFNF